MKKKGLSGAIAFNRITLNRKALKLHNTIYYRKLTVLIKAIMLHSVMAPFKRANVI